MQTNFQALATSKSTFQTSTTANIVEAKGRHRTRLSPQTLSVHTDSQQHIPCTSNTIHTGICSYPFAGPLSLHSQPSFSPTLDWWHRIVSVVPCSSIRERIPYGSYSPIRYNYSYVSETPPADPLTSLAQSWFRDRKPTHPEPPRPTPTPPHDMVLRAPSRPFSLRACLPRHIHLASAILRYRGSITAMSWTHRHKRRNTTGFASWKAWEGGLPCTTLVGLSSQGIPRGLFEILYAGLLPCPGACE